MHTGLNNRTKKDAQQSFGTIWKYPLEPRDVIIREVPKGAKALHVGADPHGHLCIWFLVSPEEPLEERAIMLVGTGHPVPIDAAKDYVGTLVVGEMVHHVFAPLRADN